MASQWALVDDQFPNFQGDESVPEQIRALVNFMFVLAEQLKYMLSNLKSENWNDASLQTLTQETSDAAAKTVEEQLAAAAAQMETLGKQLGILASVHEQDIAALEEDINGETGLAAQVTALQEDVSWLHQTDEALQETVNLMDEQIGDLEVGLDEEILIRKALQQTVEGETGLVKQMAALAERLALLAQILQHEEEENTVTLGGEGKEIRIVGKAIYVNDTLIGGTADETA